MKKLLLILTIILLPSMAFANFSVMFENTFNKKMYYVLYWIDHPYDWPGPANVAGGELGALKSVDLNANYSHGKYYVIWRDTGEWRNEMLIVIEEDVTLVTVTPKKRAFIKRKG